MFLETQCTWTFYLNVIMYTFFLLKLSGFDTFNVYAVLAKGRSWNYRQ